MSVVVEAERATDVLAHPATGERADTADALEELIASHRAALLELAPHQVWRRVREDTAWHIAELGLLLRHRDTRMQTGTPAPSGVHLPERGPARENTGTDHLRH